MGTHHKDVQKARERGKIEWQMWANVLGVLGGSLLILGGTIGQFGFKNSEVATFAIVWGVIVLMLEWPRSKRLRGNTLARAYQSIFVPVLERFGKYWSNLYPRSCAYIGSSIPTFFCLPCVFGGIVLIISGVVYIVAAFKGEQWKALYPRSRRSAQGQVLKAPSKPPPRRPDAVTPKIITEPTKAPPRKPEVKAAPRTAPSMPPPSRPVPSPMSAGTTKRAPPVLMPEQSNASAWTVEFDPSSGQNYYHNTESGETTWDRPAELGSGAVVNSAFNETSGI